MFYTFVRVDSRSADRQVILKILYDRRRQPFVLAVFSLCIDSLMLKKVLHEKCSVNNKSTCFSSNKTFLTYFSLLKCGGHTYLLGKR